MDDGTQYQRHDVHIIDCECGSDIQLFLQISCMPKFVSAGPSEPEPSQRNAFDVLMAGSSSKLGKSLPSAKKSRN